MINATSHPQVIPAQSARGSATDRNTIDRGTPPLLAPVVVPGAGVVPGFELGFAVPDRRRVRRRGRAVVPRVAVREIIRPHRLPRRWS